jgi:mono/diheme cytochrome c family protein
VKKAFDRLARVGVQTLVFGSGGARRVPDGFSKDEAFKQLVDFGKRIAPEARARGITVLIEPLRRQESNIINTAAEGFALVKAIGDPNFQLMIDFYHLASEQEDPAIVIEAKDVLRHLHMANPQGRVFPLAWEEFNYAPFFANLRKIGYDRRMSVEAAAKDYAHDAPLSIALLRKAFSGDVPATQASAPPAGGRAQSAPPPPPPSQGSVGPRPNVGPADRPVVEAAAVERGKVVWAVECITCHGASARGSDTVPSLLRSTLVLRDRGGNELGPFLKKGHPTQSGTPSANLTAAQAADLMQFLRQRINDTLRGSPVFTVQDILTGDATAGAAYFNGPGKCTTCHQASGDLKGIGGRLSPVDVQQRMLFPVTARGGGAGRGAPGGGAAPPSRTAITVTLTPATGAAMTGVLVQEDDFFVTFRDEAGAIKVVRRTPGMKVAKVDPLQAHRELLDTITDKNIHDLVAYLVTLK